jgi:uncharacterized protein (TIGR02001 family)
MKKVVLSAVAALALSAVPALAADMPVKAPAAAPAATPLFDIAIGGLVQSDYNFRGVSQSNRGPSGGAYFEPDFTTPIGTLYVGVAGWAIDWPSGIGFTAPSAEIDFYGGWRNSWGPLSLDLGLIYYYYPKETFNGVTDQSDFYEFYAKAGYEVVKGLTFGATVFYTPDLLHYSTTFAGLVPGYSQKADAVYASATGKWVLPWTAGDLGAYLSGELGHWWINDSGFTNAAVVSAGSLPGVDPSYTYWNAGLAITYKALTLDLRYYGNDMSVAQCASFLLTTVGNASNNWCDDTFIAALKFDTTINSIK